MPVLRFLDWTPDAADLGSAGAITATNALPGRDGYKPFRSLSVITNETDDRPLGGIEAYDIDEVSHQYVGDETNLYELDSNLEWVDVSGTTYTTAAGEAWEFVRWKNKILATNFSDDPQQIVMGDAAFSDLTTDFKARCIAVVGDFVVAANTYDASDGNMPNRVRWCAIADETDWTPDPSTLSDFRDLAAGGPIRKVIGGEVGVIVCQRSVHRMSFIGAPAAFQIVEVQPGIGAIARGAVVGLGDSVYFPSERGFVELTGGGTGVNFIGAGRVDKFFSDDLDTDYLSRISSIADPTGNRIAWAYPGSGHNGGTPNKIIIYDRTFGKWCLIEQEVELLLRASGIPFTLDELDGIGYPNLDTMDVSLDSGLFKGAASQMAAFGTDLRMGFFRGLNMAATLETQESEIFAGANTQLNGFRPLVDLGTVTAQVGSRNRLTDDVSWGPSINQSSGGKFNQRVNARYHRVRLTVTGNLWVDALGVQIDPSDARRAGGRG